MKKLVTGIIKQGEKVLLVQQGPFQPYAGQWGFPYGEVQGDERAAQALKRELREKLGIEIDKPKLATNITQNGTEVYAYFIDSYAGEIKLKSYQNMKWTPFVEMAFHTQVPADRKNAMKLTGIKEDSKEKIDELPEAPGVSKPEFNPRNHSWRVRFDGDKEYFFLYQEARAFYLKKVYERLYAPQIKGAFGANPHIRGA